MINQREAEMYLHPFHTHEIKVRQLCNEVRHGVKILEIEELGATVSSTMAKQMEQHTKREQEHISAEMAIARWEEQNGSTAEVTVDSFVQEDSAKEPYSVGGDSFLQEMCTPLTSIIEEEAEKTDMSDKPAAKEEAKTLSPDEIVIETVLSDTEDNAKPQQQPLNSDLSARSNVEGEKQAMTGSRGAEIDNLKATLAKVTQERDHLRMEIQSARVERNELDDTEEIDLA